MCVFFVKKTGPKTNIAPKQLWFPIGISFPGVYFKFSGAMLVSGKVIISYAHEKTGGLLGLTLTPEFLGVPRKSLGGPVGSRWCC